MNVELKERIKSNDGNLRKVDGMISVMKQFCSLLKKENASLEKYKLKDVEKFVDAKDKIIGVYGELYQFFAENPDIMRNLDGDKKKEIATVSNALQELMMKNEDLLRVNIDTSRRIVDMIIEGARKQVNEESGVYSSKGALGQEKNEKNVLSYNQVF